MPTFYFIIVFSMCYRSALYFPVLIQYNERKERLEVHHVDEKTDTYSRELSISHCLSSGHIFWHRSGSPGRWFSGGTAPDTPCCALNPHGASPTIPLCKK